MRNRIQARRARRSAGFSFVRNRTDLTLLQRTPSSVILSLECTGALWHSYCDASSAVASLDTPYANPRLREMTLTFFTARAA